MARRVVEDTVPEPRDAALCRRAFRFRRRGDDRRAMLLLREAAYENEHDAKIWTLYGVQCARVGRTDVAHKALSHAVWLRERQNETRKALVTRDLLSRLVPDVAA
ncbi:MAG TPA: hypothetical protein VH142_08400 [Polyangiaceae bacterium]|jgi:Flp pilus assembly protein TadD|nr:hypothetical protein [Polyangiaceae bacterium]